MNIMSMEDMLAGIVTAALWADLQWPEDDPQGRGGDNGESGGGESEFSIVDVEPESLDKLRTLCYEFVAANLHDVALYVAACEDGTRQSYDPSEGSPLEYLGHDVWLSAGGHGTGCWDRGLGALGDRLHEASKVTFGRFESSGLPWVTSNRMISFE